VPSQIPGVLTLNQRPRLPTKVSFKGGSHLDTLNPSTVQASTNLGTRFLLRVVVCNIPSFYQKFGTNFLFCFVSNN
jgi:hypothetical protein